MKKTCIFYGNCQVIYNVHDVLNSLPEFVNQYELITYVNHDRDQIKELSNINTDILKKCDLFIYQPLGENHGVFSSENIKKYLKEDCIKISFPYIYNSSFYTTYWESASPRWTIGTLVNCGWKNIMKLIIEDYKIEDILNLYDSGEIDFYFEERMNICMTSLKEKENNCDIKVTKFILDNYKDKRLFITQNHLTNYFSKWITNNILEMININTINNVYLTDNKIEVNCVIDYYSKKYYNFSYSDQVNNDATKFKIKEFYKHFLLKKHTYNINDLLLYNITNDPEKFIDTPYE